MNGLTFSSLSRRLVLLLFALYAMLPVYLVVLSSVRSSESSYDAPLNVQWPLILSSYVEAWVTAGFSGYFINSLKITVTATAIVVVLACMAAYAFSKMRMHGRELLFSLFLAGLVVPAPAIIVALYGNLHAMHLLDTHLGVILPQAAILLPFSIFMMRSFFNEIPDELIEAAHVDGASPGVILRQVVLPLASPAIRSLALIVFMFAWQEYLLPLVVIQTDALKPLTVGAATFQGRYGVNIPGIAAAGVITFLPILLLFILTQRSFVRGLTAGAGK